VLVSNNYRETNDQRFLSFKPGIFMFTILAVQKSDTLCFVQLFTP